MAEVAKANGVPFVDLFQPTQELYAKADEPLTINGIHLTPRGQPSSSPRSIDQALFGEPTADARRPPTLEKLRQAVLDKNFYWFNRYRTVDGYSIYGGRADLKFVGGQTNREVAQREMEVLDVMTANRDKRIWAVAQGERPQGRRQQHARRSSRSRRTSPAPARTARTSSSSGEEAIEQDDGRQGAEGQPVRLREGVPRAGQAGADGVRHQGPALGRRLADLPALEAQGGDERQAPHLRGHRRRRQGRQDDRLRRRPALPDRLRVLQRRRARRPGARPDVPQGHRRRRQGRRARRACSAASTRPTRTTPSNSFALDPGGALYFQEGTFHHTQVETPYGPPVRCANAGVFRYEPRTQKFEVYVTYGFANPHGHVFDRWGQDIVADGTGANPYHGALFSGHLDYPDKHGRPPQVYQQRTRPCPGIEILSSRHFPDEMQGNLLVANVIGFQGILQYKIERQGRQLRRHRGRADRLVDRPELPPVRRRRSGRTARSTSSTGRTRSSATCSTTSATRAATATHGRIYRVTYEGRPLLKPAEDRRRADREAARPAQGAGGPRPLPGPDRAGRPRQRRGHRRREEVGRRPRQERRRLRAPHARRRSGCTSTHNVVERRPAQADARARRTSAPGPRPRACSATGATACPTRSELLKKLAADAHPRVRLEAVRAASFFTVPEAVEVALIAAEQPTDEYLDFVRGETMRALEPYREEGDRRGQDDRLHDAGRRALLPAERRHRRPAQDEADAAASTWSCSSARACATRSAARPLAGLAKLDKKTELRVLLDAIRSQDDQQATQDESVVFDLVRLLTEPSRRELAGVRGRPGEAGDRRPSSRSRASSASSP